MLTALARIAQQVCGLSEEYSLYIFLHDRDQERVQLRDRIADVPLPEIFSSPKYYRGRCPRDHKQSPSVWLPVHSSQEVPSLYLYLYLWWPSHKTKTMIRIIVLFISIICLY